MFGKEMNVLPIDAIGPYFPRSFLFVVCRRPLAAQGQSAKSPRGKRNRAQSIQSHHGSFHPMDMTMPCQTSRKFIFQSE